MLLISVSSLVVVLSISSLTNGTVLTFVVCSCVAESTCDNEGGGVVTVVSGDIVEDV